MHRPSVRLQAKSVDMSTSTTTSSFPLVIAHSCALPIGLHGSILPPRSSLPRFRSVQHLALVPSRRPGFLTYFVEPLCLLVGFPTQ